MQPFPWGKDLALTLMATLAAPALVAAQDVVAPTYIEIGPAEIHGPDSGLDIPQPPGQIQATPALPTHGLPPVPVGAANGIPEPNSPPISGIAGPGAPCDLRYFVNRVVNPGGNTSTIAEPSAAFNRDTSFFTWNWGAALSRNSGVSWDHVNPYTKFPAIDGGFCCDQRTLHVTSPEMTIWFLQYVKSTTTQLGHCRIAIASNRADLASNTWHSYTFAPDNFGFGTGEWLDFPDIAVSNGHLYCASNIFAVSNDAYVDSVIWKMPLSSLDAGGLLAAWYWTRSSNSAIGGGGSFRLSQGATGTMYIGSHNSTSQLRVSRNADSPSNSSIFSADVNVSSWSGGSMVATAPNGVNWAGRADNRITGAYATPTEYGFMWHVGRRPASNRDQVYVRVSRLSTATNALINEQDIFNSTWAFLYPAVTVNASGEPGYTCAFGQGDGNSAGRHPTNFFRVVDPAGCGVNFAGGSISVPFGGGSSPTSAAWGDYFSLQRSNNNSNTFVASGMARNSAGQQQPRYVWFGKEEDTPTTPIVTVEDNLLVSVPITVTHTDLDLQTNGTTPFTRRYPTTARYELTAPATVDVRGNTYLFCNWALDVNGGTNFADQPAGQRTLSVDSIGVANDRARAVYVLQTVITVNDRNVGRGVPITVGTTDLDGNKNGTTSFSRRYKGDAAGFAFTAPATAGNQPFRRWYVSNIAQPIGQQTITVTPLTSALTIEAEYCSYAVGGYSTYGTGCAGSNGQVPSHTSSSTPDIGAVVTHSVSGLRGPAPAVMFLGFSKTLWNGFPLPLSLGFIGANPACNVLAEGFLQLPITINGAGSGSRTFTVTGDPSAIGMHTYTQVIAADLFLADPIPLVASNGLDMLIGGSSIGGQRCP